MTGFLIDTNVISEVRKGRRADPTVRAWLADRGEDDLWTSVLVLAELRRGALLIERRDIQAATAIAAWLDRTIESFGDRVLPVTAAIAQRWARLSVPDPVPVVDGLLAATALEHGLVLATRNHADVARTGVGWVNPFG